MRKTITTISIAAAATIGSTGFAVAAQATTTACATGTLGAYCGTQADGNQLAVATSGTPAYNRAIVAEPNASVATTDFAWFVPAGNFPAGSKQAMVTPSGALSGYCLSDPDQVYAGHANAHAIVERPCSGENRWQTWTFNGSGWTNSATGLVLTDNGKGKPLTDATAVSGDAAQTWAFSS